MKFTRAIVGVLFSFSALVSITACSRGTTESTLPPAIPTQQTPATSSDVTSVDMLIDQKSGTAEDRKALAEYLALVAPAGRKRITMIRGDRAISTKDVKFPLMMGRTEGSAHRMTLANGHVVDFRLQNRVRRTAELQKA